MKKAVILTKFFIYDKLKERINFNEQCEVIVLPVIKKITVQKKNKERYNIFFENGNEEAYAFSVSEDVLLKHQLMKGKELSEADMQEIFFREEIQKAYNQAINFLSYRMRSEKEVYQHVTEKGYSIDIVKEVIVRLKNNQFINDREFAMSFVRTQINTGDKGPKVINGVLKEKGINVEIIEEAVSLFSPELQLEKAEKLCRKWIQKKKQSSLPKLKLDLQAMLVRKGYVGGIANQAIGIALEDVDEDQEWNAIVVQGEKAWNKYHLQENGARRLKVKQFLFRKGFPLELIDRFLAEKQSENF
ncbi:recombination regulator RecX [Caldibacillus lycopersici]|uniref:Regulatory protein RecX n=1 Tax=Perspicuibacillus lycopersici TaxID=1325689 RepID=A0AAE3IXC1_9BACI|nr:recombination regulator RecX [Perspicuibacillus lycopersici]MCU9614639.1 recombination regulator RecX [Perspicuibacillus lycopersici]